jgi:hypothetical protein
VRWEEPDGAGSMVVMALKPALVVDGVVCAQKDLAEGCVRRGE